MVPFLVLSLMLALSFSLRAATAAPTGTTIVVDSTADAVDANLGAAACATSTGACTLRAAIQQANALAGHDVIQLPAGTYAIALAPQNENLANTGDFDITGPLTLVGAGAGSTLLDGGAPTGTAPEMRGRDRLFEIHPGAGDVSIVGITIQEGYTADQGGGILNATAGTLLLEDVRVIESYAAKYGGGIANTGSGTVKLVGSSFSGNGAKEGGAAIHNAAAGTVSITAGSEIADNPGNGSGSAPDDYPVTGGAINNEGEGDTIGTIEVVDSTIARNEASSNGAGIHNERDGRIVVEDSEITENRTSASGAGIYSVSGTVHIRGGTVAGNQAGNDISSGSGGGIYNAGQLSKAGTPGRLEITNATISGNTATADGAGIYCGLDADLVVRDSTISNNEAEDEGGGISTQSKADMSVTNVTFTGNTAHVAGGGAYVYAEGLATFTDTSFVGNHAGETGGGGLYTDGSGSVSVDDSTFRENTSVGDGGGLFVSSGGEQTITDTVVDDNSTDEGGGGIFNSGMVVTFERLSITSNEALLDGGGIKSEGSGQFTILDTSISGNAAENGGGFTNAADGTMSIHRTALVGNTARGDGGGYLEIGDANSLIENSTLSGNSAGDRGGGVYTNADAELRVTNVTITNNTARAGSGLSTSVESLNFPVVPATAVILRNTFVAGNLDGINCHGAVFSDGGNFDDGTTCFFSDPSDITRTEPMVEPLADNGGRTLTHALKSSSAAIDGGVSPCPATDQRDVSRPKNAGCDIGAYEFEGTPTPGQTPLPPPTGPDSVAPTVTLDSKPAIRTLDTTAEFAFRADEIARFECVLNPPVASFSGCESPHDYTNLALGLNIFQVRAIDASNNVGEPVSYTWRVVEELVPPETTITSPVTSPTSSTSRAVTFAANEPASFECSFDGAEFTACVSPVALANLADGEHTFRVQAIDTSFNPDGSPASQTWTVDTLAPETAIDTKPSDPTNDTTPGFTFSSPEAGASFECALGAGAFTSCASGHELTLTGEGLYTFSVRARDAAGNVDGSPASTSFRLDTTAPLTTIGDPKPAALTKSKDATFTFSASEQATFQCALDSPSFADCSPGVGYTDLADGPHTFRVQARDTAGNNEATPATHTWTIDATPPETELGSGPNELTQATTAAFTFSSEPGAEFECALDSDVFAACESGIAFSQLSDGSHTFSVRARDAAGNVDGSPASQTWTVDTLAPETAIDTKPSDPTNDTTPGFTFSSPEAGASFECALGAGAFTSCASGHELTLTGEGLYTFSVRARDAAGNVDGSPASTSFRLDTTAPLTTIGDPKPAALTKSKDATFTFSASEQATFQCALDSPSFADCSPGVGYTDLADGPHTFRVQARDTAGNNEATPATHTWTIDATPPVVTLSAAPASPTKSTEASFTFSSEPGATLTCLLDGIELTGCDGAKTLSGLSSGEHTFVVRATDAAGNVGSESRTWTVDTTPPVVTIDSGPSGTTTATTATFTFTAEQGVTLTCLLDNVSQAPCTSPKDLDALSVGLRTFEIRATDAAGNTASASRSWTIVAPDTTPPVVTLSAAPTSPTSSTTATFEFSSEEGATITCLLDDVPQALCTSPKTLSGLGSGQHTFVVRATDVAGNTGSESRTWTVDTLAPVVTLSTAPTSPTTSTSATFEFSSEAGATLACLLDGTVLPGCASPKTLTGLGAGTRTFEVRATDLAGNTGSASRTWSIVTDTTPPAVTLSAAPTSPTSSTTATFHFSTEPGATLACLLDNVELPECSAPKTVTVAHGPHSFEVRATDAAGNTGSESRSWTVDTIAPVITIDGPTGQTTATTAQIAFSVPAGETLSGGFRCALDGASASSCTSPVNLSNLSLGAHTFRVEATDTAGNIGSTAITWSVLVAPDGTPPVVTITNAPPSPTSSTSASFTFTATEPVTFECSLDGAGFTACSAGSVTSASVTYNSLSQAQHVFQVRATDGAGNPSAIAGHIWTVAAPQQTCTGQALTLGANADTWVLESSASSNYGQDSAIKVDTKAGANARVLVRFPLPVIPAGCTTIASATLRMYAGSYKTGRTLQAVPLASTWSESSVTWSNQPATTGATASVASGSGYLSWNVTQQMASLTAATNNGFLIRDSSEGGNGIEQAFNSREKGTDNPPQLVVTFG